MKKTGKKTGLSVQGASRSKSDQTVREQMDETLREKENFIRHVIELSPVVLVVYDLASEHHTYFGNDALKVYGYTGDEMARMPDPFAALMQPEDIPRIRENVNRLKRLGDGEINEFECRIRRGDGARRWINARSMIFARDAKGEARQVISATYDVTERKEAEEKLIESEKRFRSYFELGLIGMAITSPIKGCLAVNDELCKILGYERDELLSRNWAEMTHPDDLAADVAYFNRVMSGEIDAYRLDKRWIRKDKRIIDTTISVKCVRCADGSVDYFVALLEDVTARKHLEDTLRESEENYRVIVNQAVAGIFKLDLDRKVTFSNRRFCEMLDYSLEELLEMSIEKIVYAEDLPRDNRLFERLKNQGLSFEIEKRLVRKDGSLIWVNNQVSPVFDGAGNLKSVIVVSVDITERRRAEEALRQANDELENRVMLRTRQLSELNDDLRKEIAERERVEADLERLLSRLVSAQEDERRRIAREMHDQLGQNLSALALKLSALKNDYETQPELREHFASLKRSVKQLDTDVGFLVRDLRPTALDDFGLVVALSNYARNWSKQFGVRAELHTSGMEKDRLTGEMETVLYRITQEALTNVAKHANAEHVDILLERRSDHVSLIVEDDGVGFDVERAFGAGEKGFGLIGMRERAALVAGTLAVESRPGAGATIAVRIPASQVANGGKQNG